MPLRDLLADLGAVFSDNDPLIQESAAPAKRKQMVIMVGGPASGKGHFLGEGGKGLPKSTKALFRDDDIPDNKVGFAESDNNLRGIQYFESKKHFKALTDAEKEGPDAVKKVLKDSWYKTKDGREVKLGSFGKMPPVPKPHEKFYKDTLPFYRNMRGWHDDADKINPETGKLKERFKDQARKTFEEYTAKKISEEDKDFMIIDSAGEDIDAQDFEGQIARGKAAGFEVSVVFLDIAKDDTKLSNMSRGFVAGKRMVDEQDIDNFFDKSKNAIERIKKAAPNRFLHFKRKPPLTKEERDKLVKLMTQTPDGEPTFLADPNSKVRSIQDLPEDQAKAIKGGVMSLLYKPRYTLDVESSFSDSGKDFPAHTVPNESGAPTPSEKPVAAPGGGGAPAATPKDPVARKAAQKADAKKLNPDQFRAKWGKCPNGWRHNGSGHCITRASYLAMSESDELFESLEGASDLPKFISSATKRIDKKLKAPHGYDMEVETAGTNITVRLEGASGDLTALRKIRRVLQKIAEQAVYAASGGAIKKVKLVASNHKDDMVILIEPQYP